jgi:hypothetical protein
MKSDRKAATISSGPANQSEVMGNDVKVARNSSRPADQRELMGIDGEADTIYPWTC